QADRGTGLGLSISYGIIKDHGGILEVESKKGEYTAFVIDLPIDYSPNKELKKV
ncbi:MAG: ATP-binding protein, partial [bacterium]